LVDAHTDMVINALVNVLSPWHMGWTGTICRHPAVKRNQSNINTTRGMKWYFSIPI